MEIACPNCAKRFRVPDEKLAPRGRKVRCASCGNTWFQAPPANTPAAAAEPARPAAPPAPPPPPDPRRSDPEGWPADAQASQGRQGAAGYDRPPIFDGPHLGEPRRFELSSDADYDRLPRRRSRIGLVIGWLLLLLVVGALVGGGWYYRNQVVETVPELQQIYDLLGVPLEAGHPGVVLQNVTTQVNTVDENRVMTITGTVENISDQPREVPLLIATVTDKTGAVLVEWRFDAGQSLLEAGQTVDFTTRREAIPRGELSVRVDFVLP